MESDSEQELKPNRIQVHRDRAQSLMLTCASKANNEPRIKPTLICMSLDKGGSRVCGGKLGENLTKKTKNKSNVFTSSLVQIVVAPNVCLFYAFRDWLLK